MRIHTPHLGKRSEKRKVSIAEPVVAEDTAVIEIEPIATGHYKATDNIPHPIKLHKPKPKKAKQESKQRTRKSKSKPEEIIDPHPGPDSDLDFDLEPKPQPGSLNNNPEMIAAMQRSSSPIEEQPDTNTPRRSSRIKDSMNKIGGKWHKVRPYVERINGTIMPLEHQGTAAYYNRDGIKLDERPTGIEGRKYGS